MTENRKTKKPLIGIVPLVDTERESWWMLPGYMEGIRHAGGLPVMLPLTSDPGELDQITETCQGILFTGGQDVSPSVYGEPVSFSNVVTCCKRDEMELALLQKAMEKDLPVLGICRGIQLFNAALGGTLYQDLPSQHPSNTVHAMRPPYDQPAHMVELLPDSALFSLLQKNEIPVNSYHHQAIRTLAPSLKAMAVSSDGLIEAVEIPEKSFFWAVQWHPEFSWKTSADSRRIFAAFADACRKD